MKKSTLVRKGPRYILDLSKYMYFGITDLAKLYTDRNPDFNAVVTHTDSHATLPALLQKATDAIMVLEVVAKPHKHFRSVTITKASSRKATNILI
jgi:hypothetical protein